METNNTTDKGQEVKSEKGGSRHRSLSPQRMDKNRKSRSRSRSRSATPGSRESTPEVDMPSEMHPYRAQYARSGAAKCRRCWKNIKKNELRLATVAHSRIFEGMQSAWYHFDCFFLRCKPSSVGDMSHFETLRWEDQQRIRDKIENVQSVGSAGGRGTVTGDVVPSDFHIEYAKSNRSTCVACETKIPKEEIRIGKIDYESYISLAFSPMFRWYHVDCFKKLREQLNFTEDGNYLPGFYDLKKRDQALIKSKFSKIKTSEPEGEMTEEPEAKKAKIEEEEAEKEQGDEKKKPGEKETGREKILHKQNQDLYAVRDMIAKAHDNREITRQQLVELFQYNDQDVPSGHERIYDCLADIMTFGALERCMDCGGQYIYRSGIGYYCTGDITDDVKCENVTNRPKRFPFRVPKWILNKLPFLEKYHKKKVEKRIIPKHAPAKMQEEPDPLLISKKMTPEKAVAGYTGPKITEKPLQDFRFYIDPKLDEKLSKNVCSKIEEFGGKVLKRMTRSTKVAAMISTKELLEKEEGQERYIEVAKEKKVPVLPPDFVDTLTDTDYDLQEHVQKRVISDWVTPGQIGSHLRHVNPNFNPKEFIN